MTKSPSSSKWTNHDDDPEAFSSTRPLMTIGSQHFHFNSTLPESILQPSSVTENFSNRNLGTKLKDVRLNVQTLGLDPKKKLKQGSTFAKMPALQLETSTKTKFSNSLLPLNISKSAGTLPSIQENLFKNQQSDEVVSSHVYSIEKMATSCFHAIQHKDNKTWLIRPSFNEHFNRKIEKNSIQDTIAFSVERPFCRMDVLDLDRCLDAAIDFATRKTSVVGDENLSILDQDLMAMFTRTSQRFGSKITDQKVLDNQEMLTKSFFEQKWSDVVLGELESMLTVSFREQSHVLRKCRHFYAAAFFQLEQLYEKQWHELKKVNNEIDELREERQQTLQEQIQVMERMKTQFEEEMETLRSTFEREKCLLENQVTELETERKKMDDMLKCLNENFRQLRQETEKINAVEVWEKYKILENKYEETRQEIKQLREIREEKLHLSRKMEEFMHEHEMRKDQIKDLNTLIRTKDTIIASLMEQQQLMADGEKRHNSQEKVEKERKDRSPTLENESVGAVDTELSVELRASENLKISSKPRRLPCLYFRILLPNLNGRRPQRDIQWTLSCMRAIVLAKQLDNAMCQRTGSVLSLRIRMPEFVYAWFSPSQSFNKNKSMTDNLSNFESKQTEANEARWALYYGVKALIQEGYIEAKLFLSLLDETFGEDEETFLLHCYHVLNELLDGRLHWGPVHENISYEQFSREYDTLLTPPLNDSDALRPKNGIILSDLPKIMWISLYHASVATNIILSKATEGERATIDRKMQQHAVTSLPNDERPRVYLKRRKEQSFDDGNQMFGTELEGTGKDSVAFVDAHLWLHLMLLEYREEQTHRRAMIRLMFQTATAATAAAATESAANLSLGTILDLNYISMDIDQFHLMLHTLNDAISPSMVATLFRNVYIQGKGTVNFDSFMKVAENWQFFSSCLRLKSPSSMGLKGF